MLSWHDISHRITMSLHHAEWLAAGKLETLNWRTKVNELPTDDVQIYVVCMYKNGAKMPHRSVKRPLFTHKSENNLLR